MPEKSKNDPSPPEDSQISRLDDEAIPNDARPICAKCLRPCHPLQYYCDRCASNDAINPLTPYIGYVNIRFCYDIYCTMWRKIFSDRDTSIANKLLYAVFIVLYCPVVVVVGLPALLICKVPPGPIRNAILVVLALALIGLGVFYAYH
ncbi:MAG: hypothetical protein JW720_13760 [Sedimentisphaerales bacterium]|nr:hypothetical protein [Sedimentisphaerales bacterium]